MQFGSQGAFRGACRTLLHQLTENGGVQLYDAVLIDEAQDLPQPFFELVYRSLKEPKRIMWAYDELQT